MIDTAALNALFLEARTQNGWLPKPVLDADIKQAFDIMKMAPTSANCQPARFVFLRSVAAKERIRATLSPGNLEKTMSAPVVAIVAYDTQFQEHLPRLFPHAPNFRAMFDGEEKKVGRETAAFRNGTLQAAYFILALRAVGLDSGAMSGFNAPAVDTEFFPDGRFKSNFLLNIGYGDPTKVMGRSPRFGFDEVCQVL
jgi:3-hydroxypropanoate dehydrogenase